MNQINENENKGFSLVELIVVIAIMAVLTSVLAPSLLSYVEKSRMQKDDSAMGEVTNAIKLALADQNVYDECLKYSSKSNYSCYADSSALAATNPTGTKVSDKAANAAGTVAEQWHYADDARVLDEEEYTAAGNMRGLTITFAATSGTNTAEFVLAKGKINQISKLPTSNPITIDADIKTTLEVMSTDTTPTADVGNHYLYNKLRAAIGNSITLSSQTYRNSEYTVFIRMGTLGGNDAASQDAINVYGQWNGTNLS